MIQKALETITGSVFCKTIRCKQKARQEALSAFSNTKCPPILIYTMGKVGSSTVHKSLLNAPLPNAVLHLHFLSSDIKKHIKFHKDAEVEVPYSFYLGEAINRLITKDRNLPVKIISLVRDPVAFFISNVFQNPRFSTESVLNSNGAIDTEKAIKYINQKIAEFDALGYVFNWFDRELKEVFDIDVFASPFPVEYGYSTYRKGNTDVMLIRLEDLSDKGPLVISEFLGLRESLILKEDNVRADSTEKTIYQQVRKGFYLDDETCGRIYSSRFVKHFYNEAMIEAFIAKWTKLR